MSTDEGEQPPPAVAVSPGDQSSDREQSDADNVVAVAAQARAQTERDDARDQAIADLGVTNDRIDRLVNASERQTETNEQLALAMVEYQERAKLARRRFRVQVALIIAGFLGLYIWQEVGQSTAQDTRDQIRQTNERIVSCVDPNGQCYKDGQARTAQAVSNLTQASVLAAACAPSYTDLPLGQRIAGIFQCIQHNLR